MNLINPKVNLSEVFQDVNGSLSHKRVITIVAFLLFCFAFAINIFFSIEIDINMINTIEMIILGGMGVSVIEHFGRKKDESFKNSKKIEETASTLIEEFNGIMESDIEPAPKNRE